MRRASLVFLAAALALPASAGIPAVVFTVNTTADGVDANPGDGVCATSGGLCTLRAAIMETNHTLSGPTEIHVPANANPYVLTIAPSLLDDETTGDLNITRATGIVGAGAAGTIVDGNLTDRVFDVAAAVSDAVLIAGLAIRNGFGQAFFLGGGVRNAGTLFIYGCLIHANYAGAGGGIYNAPGAHLEINRSTVSGNQALGDGGGLYDDGQVNVFNSTFKANYARRHGGGIAFTATGGGLLFYSTVAQNLADSNFDGTGIGGGLYHDGTAVSVAFDGTIVANNFETTGPPYVLATGDCFGTFAAHYSILQTNRSSECTTTEGPVTVADPLLGSFGPVGGQIPMFPLSNGSPAINTGNPSGCADPYGRSQDEREAHRPAGPACDIGAYEKNANGDVNGDGARSVSDIFYLINFLFAGGAAPMGLGDVNGDTKTDVADVFYLINFLFAGGAPPL
jgi:CSLREA domain-containing protein